MGLDWTLELIDRISAPATTVASALQEVNDKLYDVGKAIKTASLDKMTDPLKKARAELQMQRDWLKRSSEASEGARASTGRLADGMSWAVAKGELFADMLRGAASGAAGLVSSGIQYAAQMAAFKDNTLFAMKYVAGGQEGAQALFERAGRMARELGGDTQEVAGSLLKLRQRGFNEPQTEALIAGLADLEKLSPGANAAGIIEQIAQAKGKGTLKWDDFKLILQSGAPAEEIRKHLRDMTGAKDDKELEKMMAAGKVSADAGVKAILQGIQDKGGGGPLGQVAKAFSQSTVTGAIDNLKGRLKDLFLSVDSSPIASSLKGIADQLSTMLDPTTESGKRMMGAMNDAVTTVAGALKNIDPQVMIGAMKTAEGAVKALGLAAQGTLGIMVTLGLVNPDTNADHHIEAEAQAESDRLYAKKQQDAVLHPAAYGADVVGGPGMLSQPQIFVTDEDKARTQADMAEMGRNASTGLANGLLAGLPTVSAASTQLGAGAVYAVRDELGIRSPSRVMAELGGYTADGFAMGVSANTNDAQRAMRDLVSPSAALGAGLAPGSLGAGAGGGLTITFGDIHLVAGADGTDGAAAADDFKRQLAAALEEIASEYGLGTPVAAA